MVAGEGGDGGVVRRRHAVAAVDLWDGEAGCAGLVGVGWEGESGGGGSGGHV